MPEEPAPDPRARADALPVPAGPPSEALAWLDDIADGLLVLSADGAPHHVNRALCGLTGYTREELLHLRLQDVLSPDEAARSDRFRVERLAGRPAPTHYSATVVRKSGERVPVEVSIGETAWRGSPAVIAVIRDISEHRKFEEELRRIGGRGPVLHHKEADLFGRVLPDGTVLFANPPFCRLLGLPENEVIGRNLISLAPESYRERTRVLIERAMQERGVSVGESEMVLPDGGSRWYQWTTTGLFDAQGRSVECEISARDITESRRMEEALRSRDAILSAVAFAAERFLSASTWEEGINEAMERLRIASGVTRVHLWECDFSRDGDVRFVLRRLAGPVGSASADVLADAPVLSSGATGILSLLEPLRRNEPVQAPRPEHPKALHDFLKSRGIGSLLAVPIQAGGPWWGCLGFTDERTNRAWSALEVDALRAAGSILGAHFHREAIIQALRSSEEKYRSLVEDTSLPMTISDAQGIVHFANSAAAAVIGASREQIVGRQLTDLFKESDIDPEHKPTREAIALGRPRRTVVKVRLAGDIRWFEIRIHPLPEAGGRKDLVLAVAMDITEQERARQEVVAYQERLRSLTSELALSEQRERRRIAQELHDRIGQALAVAKMKLDGADTTLLPEDGQLVVREARALIERTIEDTRALTFDLSPPILYELGMDAALEWLSERFAAEHGLEISFRPGRQQRTMIEPDLRSFIFQTARELLMNVAKHARARRVQVVFRRSGREAVLEVSDDGAGFDVESVLRSGTGSAGFGLFSIRERVLQLGGRLEVESQGGAGCRVVLRMPTGRPAVGRAKGEDNPGLG